VAATALALHPDTHLPAGFDGLAPDEAARLLAEQDHAL
jgi:hypothetical protein